ncbi:MAG TPA: 5-methyltetrahydropteroyltriglutamate--homocysteine S-methyltransferase [Acidimicrobiales bacterium]|nr:5-methyltetrahydropteroyltriglutamate--homocysteine S-methyltransferase [Acidimicrobiales bacterium]
MRTAVHGMPRIGPGRALKRALEGFWAGRVAAEQLEETAASIRRQNWQTMVAAGIDFVPSNDFSLYDHVLDAAVLVGAVPPWFRPGDDRPGDVRPGDDRPGDERPGLDRPSLEPYFALARGGEADGGPVVPLELTKWFDTNYHHLVPEIGPGTAFRAEVAKVVAELAESSDQGIPTMPALLGPLTFLLRSSPRPAGFDVLDLLDPLVDTYVEVLAELQRRGVQWVRFDEPSLVEERSAEELGALERAYRRLSESGDRPAIAVSTYFGHVGEAMPVLRDLPVEGVGLDFCLGAENLDLLGAVGGLPDKVLFAGVVDGRNVWANDLEATLAQLDRLQGLAEETVVSTSCSLLHVPLTLGAEESLDPDVRPWLSFAHEKLAELAVLARATGQGRSSADEADEAIEANRAVLQARRESTRAVDPAVRQRVAALGDADPRRSTPYPQRARAQQEALALPLLPTTTIGSFPQTPDLRTERAAWRAGRLDDDQYRRSLEHEIDRVVALQEEVGLDVLVHGEPERDDMVRYFADQLTGFVLPAEGWVQSYGSRCVRPPVLFGDVSRPAPMTLQWTAYAQSRTTRPVKGMLTGPVTMLRWSFVRDDQSQAATTVQLALAIGDELVDLQAAGTGVIQVDEPALREGLPLRRADRPGYLAWATRAFRLVTSAAGPATQVHTHMCYAQLGDIVDALADLDIDVVSLEAARAGMGLLGDLVDARYRGGVGPGVFDVHSPAVPELDHLVALVGQAVETLGAERLWVNPDCGLKTRRYEEVLPALGRMVTAARQLRAELNAKP